MRTSRSRGTIEVGQAATDLTAHIHQRLVHHSRLSMKFAIVIFIPLLLAAPLTPGQTVSVDRNVQVSVAIDSAPHFEMLLAADQSDASRLAICSMILESADKDVPEGVVYTSFDRGRTWSPTLRMRDKPSWDPACAYGHNSALYSYFNGYDELGGDRLDRSFDAGRTWEKTPLWHKHEERTFLTVDNSAGAHRGLLYLVDGGWLKRISRDDGESMFYQLSPSLPEIVTKLSAGAVVLSNGDVAVAALEGPSKPFAEDRELVARKGVLKGELLRSRLVVRVSKIGRASCRERV